MKPNRIAVALSILRMGVGAGATAVTFTSRPWLAAPIFVVGFVVTFCLPSRLAGGVRAIRRTYQTTTLCEVGFLALAAVGVILNGPANRWYYLVLAVGVAGVVVGSLLVARDSPLDAISFQTVLLFVVIAGAIWITMGYGELVWKPLVVPGLAVGLAYSLLSLPRSLWPSVREVAIAS